MARYISDQNKVILIHESGTYASVSGTGQWIGQVMNNSIDESEGLIETRYLGTSGRGFNVMEQGPRDYDGTLTYRNQDMRLWGWAIGSITTTSGTNSTHVLTETNNDVRQSAYTSGTLNPPISFTIEDSKIGTGTGRNFVRTLNGCIIQKATLNVKANEPVTTEVQYVPLQVTYSSGTTTAFTSVNTNRPYLWSDGTLTIGGSAILTAKDITFELDNTSVSPHYVNGSRNPSVPFQTNRNYTLNVTLDADTESIKPFYDGFLLGGSSFNVTLDLNADSKAGVTGSMHTIISMSGCRMADINVPSEAEGVNEVTLTIIPQIVNGTVYDRIVPYNPW